MPEILSHTGARVDILVGQYSVKLQILAGRVMRKFDNVWRKISKRAKLKNLSPELASNNKKIDKNNVT